MTIREAEHLSGDHAPSSVQSTTIFQDELRSSRQRPFEPLETSSDFQSSPPNMNNDRISIAGNVSSEVPGPPSSQTSASLIEMEHKSPSNSRRTVHPPWTLRKVSLFTFIGCLLVFVIVLEILYYISNKHQGPATSGEKTYYLWKYCPTATVLSFVAIYWSNLEHHTKTSMPWKLMSKKPQSAGNSLLLDYITPNFLVVIRKSARARHFPVLIAVFGSLMVIFTTVTSTDLFSLQIVEVERDTILNVGRTFDATGSDLSSVDATPVLLVSSILSPNLSVTYPQYTNQQFAVDRIYSPAFSATDSTTSLTGLAHAFSADMTCVPGSTVNSSVTAERDFWHILIDVTDKRCATGLITLAIVQRNSEKHTQAFTIGKAILQKCSDIAQPSLFMVVAQVEAMADVLLGDGTIKTSADQSSTGVSINTTVLVCTPKYKVQKAMVTTNAYGSLQKVEERPGLDNLTISNWDLWSAINRSLAAAGPVFLEGPAAHGSQVDTNEAVDVYQHLETFSSLSNTDNCTPWNGPNGEQLESFLPNNGSLWKTALNGSNATYFHTWDTNKLYSSEGTDTMAIRISDIYNNYYTQFYNVALRDHNMTNGTSQATGYMIDDNWQRLAQSKVSTRILQALLAAMWLFTTIALSLFDIKNLIPKNPCSIAAQASLLADSKFLDMISADAENATAEDLMKMTPFVDHQFSMEWWDDENGGRRFGIDVGEADFNKDGDGEGKEEEGVDVEMVNMAPKDGYSAIGESNTRTSIDIVESGS